jgi:dihydrofolate synthase/folylpolyglutamate synthase
LRTVIERRDAGGAHMIVGMLSNKDPAGLLQPFAGLGTSFHAVPVHGHDCHGADVLGAVARAIGMRPHAAESVEAALHAIAGDADGPVTVMILGSLYLAGEVLAANDEAPA